MVTRTIKNGMVKILGHWYKPRKDATQFNGERAIFGLYYGPPNWSYYDDRGLANFVFLWGPESMGKAMQDEVEYHKEWEKNIFCVDHTFHWDWWDRVGG